MSQRPATPKQLLATLSQHLNVELQLENGICALFNNQDQEVCVIELLPQSSSAVLHCAITTDLPARDHYEQLLKLNFQPDRLHGCWLALDAGDGLRLCTQCPVELLTGHRFCQWVTGFIQQVADTRQILARPA